MYKCIRLPEAIDMISTTKAVGNIAILCLSCLCVGCLAYCGHGVMNTNTLIRSTAGVREFVILNNCEVR